MKYNKNNPLRVVTLCSGYDSQCLALNRLKQYYPEFDYELVAWAEFDPESTAPLNKQPAVIAHNALFPQWKDRNLGDMTKIDWESVPDFDLLFYSTPCQSISAAGLQHGFEEGSGTRSSIIWNVRDAVKIKRPKYLCLENVKAMVSSKFVGMFNLWQLELERLGYANFAKVLNSRDYGVPQNRERIFLVSIYLDGLEGLAGKVWYNFPKPFPLEKRLKDVLEDHVDEKYYLSDKMLEYFNRVNDDKSHGHNFTPNDGGGTAFAIRTAPGNRVDDNFSSRKSEQLTGWFGSQFGWNSTMSLSWAWQHTEDTREMKLRIPQATRKGYIEVEPYGAFDWTYPESLTRRGRVQGGGEICPTIMCTGEIYVYEPSTI